MSEKPIHAEDCGCEAAVSRRRFLRASLVVAGATLTAGLLAACDNSTATATPPAVAPTNSPTALAQAAPATVTAAPATATAALPTISPLPPTATAAPATATAVPATTSPLPSTSTPGASGAAAEATSVALANRPDLPVICYHRIRPVNSDDNEGTREMVATISQFEAQIKWLVDNKYSFLSPDDVYRYYTDLAYTPPAQAVLITIDDGYATAYDNGLPVLNKYGIKAAWFIMTIPLDKDGFLTKEQVRGLDKAGHYICAHTYSHQNLPTQTDEQLATEIAGGLKELEEIVGHKISYFAYPFGAWDRHVVDKVREYGLKMAFQLKDPTDPQVPLYTVRRELITSYDPLDTFIGKVRDPQTW